jgi:hypothetical protein
LAAARAPALLQIEYSSNHDEICVSNNAYFFSKLNCEYSFVKIPTVITKAEELKVASNALKIESPLSLSLKP